MEAHCLVFPAKTSREEQNSQVCGLHLQTLPASIVYGETNVTCEIDVGVAVFSDCNVYVASKDSRVGLEIYLAGLSIETVLYSLDGD